jgi:protein-L-isoaspartate(D-aspartate) O-methyltransferase
MSNREAANLTEELENMVDKQLAAQGIADPRVLAAFRAVPREDFVAEGLREFAYRGTPLPIGHKQTISQPYIVALTIEALRLEGDTTRVLEIGTGSGYAAAVLSKIAAEVYTVERVKALADEARDRLQRLGYHNVHVLCDDGTLGWPAHAPYDGIAVAAAGPEAPSALLEQLAIGGRLVIPVGPDKSSQVLMEIVREGEHEYKQEPLSAVRFVPLIGQQGWPDKSSSIIRTPTGKSSTKSLSKLIKEVAHPIDRIESASLPALLDRAGSARVVLLGESTHGTSEFYRMRTRITQELIERFDFDFIAVEADWPDAARVDQYVRGEVPPSRVGFMPFSRFPQWMWRNQEVHSLVEWLRARNLEHRNPSDRVGFHGLDMYSMFTSIAIVLDYLEQVDPDAAKVANARYGLLTPWQEDPAAYGRAVITGAYSSCEESLVGTLTELLARRVDYALKDGERFFDAAQNARLVANAERYYRAMYYGAAASWNLRDSHMFDTLQTLLAFYGPNSRGIIWEHNSHVGNAAATEMSARGELNVGQLCRSAFEDDAYIVGFGTHTGTVAAASDWGAPMSRMRVRPSHPESYERVFHDSGVPAFAIHLRAPARQVVRDELMPSRLERAIGVVYRPETERLSHYFQASLPQQFDELIWFDETKAVRPLEIATQPSVDLPETYPFGV